MVKGSGFSTRYFEEVALKFQVSITDMLGKVDYSSELGLGLFVFFSFTSSNVVAITSGIWNYQTYQELDEWVKIH